MQNKLKKEVLKLRNKRFSEAATGIKENRKSKSEIGIIFDTEKHALTDNQIKSANEVEVPNSGAGSYIEVFNKMGYEYIIEYCTSSSAGDWDFIISKDGRNWCLAWQRLIGLFGGFKYTVGTRNIIESEKVLNEDDVIKLLGMTAIEIEDTEYIKFFVGCDEL